MSGSRPRERDEILGGVYHAQVARNDDPDGSQSRVKVYFPWMPRGHELQLQWAPVAVPMAGASAGTFTLPEVGDSVFVVFLGGSKSAPVVIGGAWSHEDAPPETNEHKKNDVRFIKSRSGHRLLFEDSSEAKVALVDRAGAQLLGCGSFAAGGDSPSKLELPAPKGISGAPREGVAATSEGGKLALICPQGKLTIEAQNVEITARKTIEARGQSVELTSSGTGKVVAAGAVKLQGGRLAAGS
jgi:uncharacterized protein involved in type VI secretion and phage assembly